MCQLAEETIMKHEAQRPLFRNDGRFSFGREWLKREKNSAEVKSSADGGVQTFIRPTFLAPAIWGAVSGVLWRLGICSIYFAETFGSFFNLIQGGVCLFK